MLYKLMSLLSLICIAVGTYIWLRNEYANFSFVSQISPEKTQPLFSNCVAALVVLTICAAIINGVGFLFVMRMLHHLNGPCLAIRKHLQEVLEEKTGSRCRMRKEDDLQDIGEMLNRIAELREAKKL